MKTQSHGQDRTVEQSGGSRRGNWRKYPFYYLLYAGAVVGVGAKLGVFTGAKMVPASANVNAPQSFGAAARGAAAQPSPLAKGILSFDEEVKQETVHEGEAEAHFIFKLSNASRKPLTIEKVETSCGCTVAQLPPVPWVLKPRDQGEIRVTMNLKGRTGKNTKDVGVFTSQGYKVLKVEAIIPPPTTAR